MKQVFISHSSKDKPVARKIAELFRDYGIRVWIDETEISPGVPTDAFANAIEQSDAFLIILTPNSASNQGWIKYEINTAISIANRKQGMQIIPFRFENCEVPASLVGLNWINCNADSNQSLHRAVDLALKDTLLTIPMSSEQIHIRHEARAPVEYAVRLVPTRDFSQEGRLGSDEREYVFVGDFYEQRGRSLKQVSRNLWSGDAFDRVTSTNLDWTAIVFEVGEQNARKLDIKPATWKSIFRILANRLSVFVPSEEEVEKMGKWEKDYIADDQDYWRDRVVAHVNLDYLDQIMGLSWGCFAGAGMTHPRAEGAIPSRVFLTRNFRIQDLNCRFWDLGKQDDGNILL